MRLLLIEDDQRIASFITKGFRAAGFSIDKADDGKSGLQMAVNFPYDAAIVDIMLPELDGLSLIEALRKRRINMPVLILSAKGSLDDRIKGLQKGGDDYLVKPFAFTELLVRIQVLIRRSTGSIEPSKLTYSDLMLDLLKREVCRSGQKIQLQPKEFALLEYLMRNADRVVSKTRLRKLGTGITDPFTLWDSQEVRPTLRLLLARWLSAGADLAGTDPATG